MNVNRRGYLKISGAVAAVSGLGINIKPISAHTQELKIKYSKEKASEMAQGDGT